MADSLTSWRYVLGKQARSVIIRPIMNNLFVALSMLSIVLFVASMIKPLKRKNGEPFKRRYLAAGFGGLTLLLLFLVGATDPQSSQTLESNHTAAHNQSQQAGTQKKPAAQAHTNTNQTATTTAPTSATKPAPATPKHHIAYTFGVDSGKLTADDIQNVGISWKDPTDGSNKIPTDIGGAIQQLSTSGFSVQFDVYTVTNDNLGASVNNYNDPDATISCSIIVDGQPIATEEAPPNGSALCSGNPYDNQSTSN